MGEGQRTRQRQGTRFIVTINFKVGRTVIDVMVGIKKPRSEEIR